MENYYKIAGLTVQMDSFGRTVRQARPYLCAAAQPDIIIRSDWQWLKARQPHLSEEDCEYLSTGSSFYSQLLSFGGMMLHASAVAVDGRAYLFSAPCGTGKSTHTQLWLKKFGSRAFILNDDKPALRREDGVWYAYGTPWSGKHDISVDTRVPVAGIAMVCRGEKNEIELFGGTGAIFSILEQTARPRGPEFRIQLLELLDKLITEVPVWKLRCNMEPGAADVSYAAMSQEKKEN